MVVYVLGTIVIVGLPFLLYCLAAFVREMDRRNGVPGTIRARAIVRTISNTARKTRWLHPALGTGLCCCGALTLSAIAGTLGTVLAAAIFSVFLFEPLRSFAIQSPAAKSSLLWMCIGGLGFSELFGTGYGDVKRR